MKFTQVDGEGTEGLLNQVQALRLTRCSHFHNNWAFSQRDNNNKTICKTTTETRNDHNETQKNEQLQRNAKITLVMRDTKRYETTRDCK